MPLPRSKTELKEYALRKLGHPVIQINIAPEQMDDRLDEAIEKFQEHHFDSMERSYFKHRIVFSRAVFPAPVAQAFQPREFVIGQTSGTRARVMAHDISNNYVEIIFDRYSSRSFDAGETIVGQTSGTTSVVDSFTLGDIENGFITLPDYILGVRKVLPLSYRTNDILFDVRYRMALSSVPDLMSFDLVGYDAFQKHMSLLDFMLKPQAGINFNRYSGRLHINFDWYSDVNPSEYLVIDADVILDMEEFNKMFGSSWLIDYVVALFREQWAQNLSKYENIQLPGGTTLNVSEMRRKAEEDLRRLYEELLKKYQRPAKPMIG